MIYPKHTTAHLLCVVTIPQDFTDNNNNNNNIDKTLFVQR